MVNQGILLGRVGKIETKNTSSGMKITNLSLVTSKKFVKNGEKQEKTTWHNVTMFSKLAEIAEQYVNVGDIIYIQGEMDNQKYTDGNGIERTKSFVIAHEMKMLPKNKEHKQEPKKEPIGNSFVDDEVPW